MTDFKINGHNIPLIVAPFGIVNIDEVLTQEDNYRYLAPLGGNGSVFTGTPEFNGGQLISRYFFNQVGYTATIGSYLDQIGFSYGNYWTSNLGEDAMRDSLRFPQGAIISWYDEGNSKYYEYVNTIDGNASRPPTTSDIAIGDGSTTIGGWKPIYNTKEYNFYPDYEQKKTIATYNITTTDTIESFDYELPLSTGWCLIERELTYPADTLESAKFNSQVNYMSLLTLPTSYATTLVDNLTIYAYEGDIASRLIPLVEGIHLKGAVQPGWGMKITIYCFPFAD